MVLSESNTRHLNGVHTVFGQITQGLEILPSIVQNDHMVSVRVTDAQ
jgi:peptidyl-prolyl cis-trans isomerase B (cyclophilin B)